MSKNLESKYYFLLPLLVKQFSEFLGILDLENWKFSLKLIESRPKSNFNFVPSSYVYALKSKDLANTVC